ncbi:hypothetical protein OFO01_07530 [Campylobacter sp. JMF_01 NE2]|uniref:hypothetical protein n=1 Tax=unclassified Campylobacter TaxID=2593542 RepID=UPI0022E9C939|nr:MULTISPECIES: hypothetical protein [unclassified Campylobacter]MDA3053184.1 hypothetical protein [Campylobacter sp. JMF_03 NE3]MDA3067633.1 hypothetical protein [Campylobacter sp. JMF_01 NE2]
MRVIGYTTANEILYELTADYAITEFGQVYERDKMGLGDWVEMDIPYFYYKSKIEPKDDPSEILKQIVRSDQIVMNGYVVDLVNDTIDGTESFEVVDDESQDFVIFGIKNLYVKVYDDDNKIIPITEKIIAKSKEEVEELKNKLEAVVKAYFCHKPDEFEKLN